MTVLVVFAVLWALWIVANVVLLLASPYLVKDAAGPFTNGLRIVIPEGLAAKVTPNEMAAMLVHEIGHNAHHHSLKNLARSCCFIPRGADLMREQEIEADDFAAAHADPAALASALRKVSFNNFDWQRAARLSRIAAQRAA